MAMATLEPSINRAGRTPSATQLTIGQSRGHGTYKLSGGESVLTASNEYIGLGGPGSFTQTNGMHTVKNALFIGSSAGGADGNGTYTFNGGS